MKNKADETKHVPDVFELLEYAYNLGIERKEKTITTVGVRVGVVGDETASRMIQTKIADNLTKK